jgi:hypothetical protein
MSRISKERMEKALEQLKTISEADYAKTSPPSSSLCEACSTKRPTTMA